MFIYMHRSLDSMHLIVLTCKVLSITSKGNIMMTSTVFYTNVVLDWILTEAPELDNEASQQFRDDQTNSAANMTFALSYQYFKMCDDRAPLYDIIKIIKTVIFDQNKLSLKATITSRCQTS